MARKSRKANNLERAVRCNRTANRSSPRSIALAMEAWRDMDALTVHLAQPAIVRLLSDFEGQYSNDVSVHMVSATQKFGA